MRAPPRLGALVAASGWPEFTNHVPGFVETLDYVFVSGADFETGGGEGGARPCAAPMPSASDVARGGSRGPLPGPLFPSDHVSVACDVDLRL